MDVLDRQSSFSGTKAATGALALPIPQLDQWLSSHIASFSGLRSANQFKGGQSNPTYHLMADSGSYVLRRKPPGKLLTSAHAIDREYKLLSALAGQDFPAARPLVYCEDESVIGTAFYVMTHIEGRVIWEPSMPGADPVERRAVFKNMAQTLARLHSFDPQAIGLGDFGKADGYTMRQVRRWSENYRLSATEDIEDMNRLIDWLPSNLPQSARAAIVHGDYRLDNLILASDGPAILAVLDWELATLGDPIADLVYHLMTWVMPRAENGGGTGSLLDLDYAALGLPTMQEHAAVYAEAAGLETIPDLEAYLAYNFFRLAAILQGIVGRVRDGTASNDNAQAMANQVRPLAQAGWLWAQKAPSR
jgi:aminoglycoside phosphotransferase (APT) family kinase protein